MLVPEALAYATIAGVSPVVGLYAAPGALLLYGPSRHSLLPMAATAALSAAAVGDLAAQDATCAAHDHDGAHRRDRGADRGGLRMGFLASFISEPVMKGFIVGLALTIKVGQLPKLLGVEKDEGDFFEQLWHVLGELGSTSGLTLVVGVAALVLVLGLKAIAPVVPASLLAVLGGIVAVHLFDLDAARRRDRRRHRGRAPVVRATGCQPLRLLDLAPAAVGVLLIGFAEGLGAAKTYAARQLRDPREP